MSRRIEYQTAAAWLDANYDNAPRHPLYTPAPIFHDLSSKGVGTLMDFEGEKLILTAAHLFPANLMGFWTYRIPGDDAPRMYPIERVHKPGDPMVDLVICTLPKILYCPYFRGIYDQTMAADFVKRTQVALGNMRAPLQPETLTSLVTGERVSVISGYNVGKYNYRVLNMPSSAGESGTGFVGDNDTLHVLSMGYHESPDPDPTQLSKCSIVIEVPTFARK